MQNILIFRFSAMGDVALLAPVVRAAVKANPNMHFTIVTRPFFSDFFTEMERVDVITVDLNNKYKGVNGILKLYFELSVQKKWDCVLDLHGVLRTHVLSSIFKISGKKIFKIDKGRSEKKQILKSKQLALLKHTTVRYSEVFQNANISLATMSVPALIMPKEDNKVAQSYLDRIVDKEKSISIGIAPFAKHTPKMWGLDNCKKLIELIVDKYSVHFFLFGGGAEEVEQLKQFEAIGDNIHIVAGEFNLKQEVALISKLSFFISMDSSNMHLASLSGIPTISIWGGTHPCFGFSAFLQPDKYSLQIPDYSLQCRPCSVFGAKPCIYDIPLCMQGITPDYVFNQLEVFNLFNLSL